MAIKQVKMKLGNKANSNLWIRDSEFEIRMHEKMMDKPPNEAKKCGHWRFSRRTVNTKKKKKNLKIIKKKPDFNGKRQTADMLICL